MSAPWANARMRPRRRQQHVPRVEEGGPVARARRDARRTASTTSAMSIGGYWSAAWSRNRRPSGAHHGVEQRAHGPDVRHQQLGPQLDRPGVRRRHGVVDLVAGVGQRVGGGDGSRRRCRGRSTRRADRRRRRRATGRPAAAPGRTTGRLSGSRECIPAMASRPTRRSATRRAMSALHGHQLEHDQRVLGREVRGLGHDAGRRLDRRDAAAVGRVAQRSAEVVAEAERRHPAGRARWPRRRSIRRP